MEITNGEITDFYLGYEDHDILTCFVQVKDSMGEQGFGGYNLNPDNSMAGYVIDGLLKTFDKRNISKLKGTPVRIKRKSKNGIIEEIGHFMEDKWFSFKDFAEELSID